MLQATLGRLAAGQDLSFDEMAAAMEVVMQGTAEEAEIALLLTALRAKGETADELAGAAAAMRRHMTPIRTSRTGLVDTCGTGGNHSAIFNVSTTAALVTAAAGVPVAKHGNRRVTSLSGSADVLAALGVNIQASVATVETCLDELGVCFCFAPVLHSAMRHVAPVRQKLGGRTIFNLLGPLVNPASAPFQVLGVGRPELRPLIAQALARLGTEHAVVVHGEDGLCEITLAAPTQVTEVRGNQLHETVWTPADFGLSQQPLDAARVDGPEASAAIIRQVLSGASGPARDLVVLNAAAAIWVAGRAATLQEGAALAQSALDSGAAQRLLEQLIQRTA